MNGRRKIAAVVVSACLGATPLLAAPALASAAAPVQSAALAGAPIQPMIAGGSKAITTRGTVALWADREGGGRDFNCGASYLGNGWVITAKHCFNTPRPSYHVQLGSVRKDGGRRLGVDRIELDARNDLALLHLEGNVAGLRTTKLPQPNATKPANGEIVRLLGWGKKADGSIPTFLRQGNKVMDGGDVGRRTFRVSQGDAKTRAGDSGGPVFDNEKQIGVISSTGDDDTPFESITSAVDITDPGIRAWITNTTGV